MQPSDACTKTGKTVLDVILGKHPKDRAPSEISIDAYPLMTSKTVPY